MSIVKRIAATVTARVDQLVGEIENHDAVVEAGIREARQAYARAHVRHARMAQEGQRLRDQITTLETSAAQWQERAAATKDDQRALDCLRRRREAEARSRSLRQSLERHRAVEERQARELAAIRERVTGFEHQRQLLRSREATADAAQRIDRFEQTERIGVDDALERWEVRVTESEIGNLGVPEYDPIEEEYLSAEDDASLRAELDALKANRNDRKES